MASSTHTLALVYIYLRTLTSTGWRENIVHIMVGEYFLIYKYFVCTCSLLSWHTCLEIIHEERNELLSLNIKTS